MVVMVEKKKRLFSLSRKNKLWMKIFFLNYFVKYCMALDIGSCQSYSTNKEKKIVPRKKLLLTVPVQMS